MTYTVRLTIRARSDIENHMDYLQDEAPDYAYPWLDEIHSAIQSLSIFPLRGTIYPKAKHHDAPIHQLIQKQHQIFYQVREDVVFVLSIHHMSQRPLHDK